MSSVINQRGLNYSIGNGVRAEFGRVTAQLALLEQRLKALETKAVVQGPPGPQGPQGPAGPQGPKGDPGASASS
jgi:hypothetical protein